MRGFWPSKLFPVDDDALPYFEPLSRSCAVIGLSLELPDIVWYGRGLVDSGGTRRA